MLDGYARPRLQPVLEVFAAPIDRAGASPGLVTAAGLVVGIGACVAAAFGEWGLALAGWLLNRTLDGLDGVLARRQGSVSDLGGMLDFLADFVVYGGFICAVAISVPDARIACTFLLAVYLLNNVALLSFASLVEKRSLDFGDERSLRFTTGLAEGTETVIAYSAICIWPEEAALIAWIFAGMVTITVVQRLIISVKVLK
ncbi:MAG: CDP-alcohol phosphatidyltransferase family protein [Solirubrobacterales bacterium]|nr:CDP-alcohol phosphatidyltransferase family protein [Solirubrobacterales bacterium]